LNWQSWWRSRCSIVLIRRGIRRGRGISIPGGWFTINQSPPFCRTPSVKVDNISTPDLALEVPHDRFAFRYIELVATNLSHDLILQLLDNGDGIEFTELLEVVSGAHNMDDV
jgi:hypothetical protein